MKAILNAGTQDSLIKILLNKKDTARIWPLLLLATETIRTPEGLNNKYLKEGFELAKQFNCNNYLGYYYNILGLHYEAKREINNAIGAYKEGFNYYKSANYLPGQIHCIRGRALMYAMDNNFKLAELFFKQAVNMARLNKDKSELALCLYYVGKVNGNLDDDREAIKFYLESIELYKELNDSDKLATANNEIATSYKAVGNFPSAIASTQLAQKIFGNKKRWYDYAGCIVNIGAAYYDMHNTQKSLECFYEGEKLLSNLGDKLYLGIVKLNIGSILIEQKNYAKALTYLNAAREIYVDQKNIDLYASILLSICGLHIAKKEFDKALENVTEGLRLKRKVNDFTGICEALNNFGTIYKETGETKKAISSFQEALDLSQKLKLISFELASLKNLAFLYKKENNFKLASEHFEKYAALKDSFLIKENADKVAEMEALYQNEKQSSEINLLNQQKETQEKEIKVNSLQRKMLMGGIAFLVALAFLIFNRYRIKQKSNLKLQSAYEEIEKSRDEIEAQKKEIVDSIHYAKRIQNSLLPTEKYIAKSLKRMNQ